ncbi:hypothetical protein [Candidatus Poriferisodalis sp.]|uniref:hypothetical protein n=1 Tax=Candidatus Poriferisodalis sp. TaxID=3101277 RepID=UPI003AF91044
MSTLTIAGRTLDELPTYAADPNEIEVVHLTDDDVGKLVSDALDAAGCTREELDQQAACGEFMSELARRMWFLVSSFDPPAG